MDSLLGKSYKVVDYGLDSQDEIPTFQDCNIYKNFILIKIMGWNGWACEKSKNGMKFLWALEKRNLINLPKCLMPYVCLISVIITEYNNYEGSESKEGLSVWE